MKNFQGSLDERSQEGNLSVEMCSHESFLKYVLNTSKTSSKEGVSFPDQDLRSIYLEPLETREVFLNDALHFTLVCNSSKLYFKLILRDPSLHDKVSQTWRKSEIFYVIDDANNFYCRITGNDVRENIFSVVTYNISLIYFKPYRPME